MERDFLGLNRKNSSKKVKEVSEVIYKHSAARMQRLHSSKILSPPQYLYSKASKRDNTFFPSRIGGNNQPLSLAKNTWTSPFNKMASSSSTSVSDKIALANNNSVSAPAKWQCFQGAPIARPFSNSCPVNVSLGDIYKKPTHLRNTDSLTIFYSGAVHVFHDIPPEQAELVMRMAGTKPMTADAKEILDLVIEESYQKSMQPPPESALAYCNRGGLAMARKATLARFLEKRMHRLSHARPYNLNAKFLQSRTPQATNTKMMVSSWQQQEMSSSATG